MAHVLVTGGTGFIGRHLLTRLVARGDSVRCLARDPQRLARLRVPGVQYVPGDITVPASLPPALHGVEVVYHLAGATLPVQRNLFGRVNAQGTRILAEACARQAGPPVVVYVSSVAAAGPSALDQPLAESAVPRPVSSYGRTKLQGEQFLRGLADRLPATVLRPPAVLGPGDTVTIKLFRLARMGLAVIPGRGQFQLSWIYVSDLVDALLSAAERGQRLAPSLPEQGVYFTALDEHPLVSAAAAMIAAVQGKQLRHVLRMPAGLSCFAGAVNDIRTCFTGRAYWVNLDKLREAVAGSWTCSPAKIKRELGFVCRVSLEEAFRRTYTWYREQGWIA